MGFEPLRERGGQFDPPACRLRTVNYDQDLFVVGR